MKRIIFMGTPDFSVPILEDLSAGFNVVLVVSQPDKPVGRKRILTPPSVISKAHELGLETFQPERIKDEDAIERIKSFEPDIIITAAYGQILPKELLEIPPYGAINVHASLLPRHRGGAPIHRAIIEGDSESGVTIMYMEEGLDSGDMISQASTEITSSDTTGSLHNRLSEIGSKLLLDTLPDIFNDAHTASPQDESLVTYSPNISKEDERLDWTHSARLVDCRIRGLSPWPGAYTMHEGARVKLYFSKFINAPTKSEAGTIVSKTENGFTVACGDGKLIEVTEMQPAGKKRMDAAQWISNNMDAIHTKFE